MVKHPALRVFISSTTVDLREYRDKVRDAAAPTLVIPLTSSYNISLSPFISTSPTSELPTEQMSGYALLQFAMGDAIDLSLFRIDGR